jgi:hypothetical protein
VDYNEGGNVMQAHIARAALNKVNLGDIVRCSNGKEYEFIRLKKSKFLGKRDGTIFDVAVELFVEIAQWSNKTQFDASSLQEGELFYILNSKQEPVCLRFKYMINANRIMAENPVTSQGYRLSVELAEGTIRSLQR